MKKAWMVVAVAAMSVSLCEGRASAQGPQGAGAGAATTQASSDKGKTSHSLNPIKWVKKDPKPASDQLEAKNEQDKKLTAKFQAEGLLPAKTDLKDACATFKALEECIAALHVSKNLGVDFNCLKSDLTGVQTGADMSSCQGLAGDKAISLTKAIQALKPDADAKAEAKNAEKQAKDDLKQSRE